MAGLFEIMRCAADVLSALYLLRFPLLTLLALILLPGAGLWAPTRSLLAGLFDVESGLSGMAFVTFSALSAAWTVALTSWLVVAYGAERFGNPLLNHRFPVVIWLVLTSVAAVPLVLTALWESVREGKRARGRLGLGVLAGVGLAVLLLVAAAKFGGRLENHRFQNWLVHGLVTRPNIGRGYIDYATPGVPALQPNHGLALALLVVLFVAYCIIGIPRYGRLGRSKPIPSVVYVLLVFMLLCWGLSGLGFFFDRYYVPVLMLAGGWVVLTALSSRSDHFFHVLDRQKTSPLPPSVVLRGDGKGDRAIVVAANGGGIQAAAWTARVLTGLELQCPRKFGQSIRMISSVSGGSVGSMYFVAAYSAHGLPNDPRELEKIVERSMASSLEAIAWGLAYPDLWGPILPCLWPKEMDRGKALEDALKAHGPDALKEPLGGWREDVRAGWRPANIFNATITDSGERLVISTADLPKQGAGRRSFYDKELYPNNDISVVTAARLSATYPYVSPAARAGLEGPQPHVVDGGYYDNYGISTLLDWLDEALKPPGNPIRRVLLIEIRGAPFDAMIIRHSSRGWFYQLFAPVATMLHVRTTGQLAYNDSEVGLFCRLYEQMGVTVEPVVFEFREPPEEQKRHAGPPLSWHLTARQKEDIEKAWQEELENGKAWLQVREFLK